MTQLKTNTGEQDSVHSSIVLEDVPTVSILHVEDDEMVASVAKEILEAQVGESRLVLMATLRFKEFPAKMNTIYCLSITTCQALTDYN